MKVNAEVHEVTVGLDQMQWMINHLQDSFKKGKNMRIQAVASAWWIKQALGEMFLEYEESMKEAPKEAMEIIDELRKKVFTLVEQARESNYQYYPFEVDTFNL